MGFFSLESIFERDFLKIYAILEKKLRAAFEKWTFTRTDFCFDFENRSSPEPLFLSLWKPLVEVVFENGASRESKLIVLSQRANNNGCQD